MKMRKILFLILILVGVQSVAMASYTSELLDRTSKEERRLQHYIDKGVTGEVSEAIGQLYIMWDMELNKVYKLIMNKLSQDKKIKLRNEQRAWIKRKEKIVKEAGKDFEGGNWQGIVEIDKGTEITKKRTIELAKMYDSLK